MSHIKNIWCAIDKVKKSGLHAKIKSIKWNKNHPLPESYVIDIMSDPITGLHLPNQ